MPIITHDKCNLKINLPENTFLKNKHNHKRKSAFESFMPNLSFYIKWNGVSKFFVLWSNSIKLLLSWHHYMSHKTADETLFSSSCNGLHMNIQMFYEAGIGQFVLTRGWQK